MTKQYFKRRWDESRGDEFDMWGEATYYFAVGDDGLLARQVEVYQSGPTLSYGPDRPEDRFGFLGQIRLDEVEDWTPWAITQSESEAIWAIEQ